MSAELSREIDIELDVQNLEPQEEVVSDTQTNGVVVELFDAERSSRLPGVEVVEVESTDAIPQTPAEPSASEILDRPRKKSAASPRVVTGTSEADAISRLADHPILTAAQEVDLAKRIERGDLDAKEELITSNQRLVLSVVYGMFPRSTKPPLAHIDLIQEGNIGLMRAAEKFDYRKGFKFSTYGELWIRQAIQRALEAKGKMIKPPVLEGRKLGKILKAENAFRQANDGLDPTDEEIAVYTGLSIDEIVDLKSMPHVASSLDLPLNPEKPDEATLYDVLADEDAEPVEEVVLNQIGSEVISEALDGLPEKTKQAVKMRYGIDYEEHYTLVEISEALGVSIPWVRSNLNRAIIQLGGDVNLSQAFSDIV